MSIITAAAAAAQGPGVPFTRIWKLLDKIHNKIYALCVVASNQSALISVNSSNRTAMLLLRKQPFMALRRLCARQNLSFSSGREQP